MSSTAPLADWLVHIPDIPGALEKRVAARSDHLAGVKPKVQSGTVAFGGATLAKHPGPGESLAMTGSVMLYKAESEEKVRELLEDDPYTKVGVWDVKNATIYPFFCAVRTPM
ncbi:hypothetical protein A1O1_06323 [Capronia coronata CBS 617.96]|uniref:YCII-related domain-containing protein n=1 Tax=Capronia coronata CBS 617.96 TaxID=1182541 RepID=W9YUJ5_9EURO|nr:uncharacterized protein A1O1_06323 [Capronia coronata CBS 617.96]EXJ85954.1 hypothetical protein A1O1_06323 [Capronia coronata CBS 617.96]